MEENRETRMPLANGLPLVMEHTPRMDSARDKAIRCAGASSGLPAWITLRDGSRYQVNPLCTLGTDLLLLDGSLVERSLIIRVEAGNGLLLWADQSWITR